MSFFIESKAIHTEVMQGHFDILYVALSYIIAVVAARIALYTLQDITLNNTYSRQRGCILGGIVMGAGIWSMHFTGMLAYKMPMYHTYSIPETIFSLLIAIAFACFVFYNITRDKLSFTHIFLNAPILGLGVAAMHYIGMAAMHVDGEIRYIPFYFWLSIGIAVTASGAAMWIMRAVTDVKKNKNLLNILASLVMGLAVCGMHYMGMLASVFLPYANCRFITDQDETILTIFVCLVTILFLGQGLFLTSKGLLKNTITQDKIFSKFGFYFAVILITSCGLASIGLLHYISSYDETIALENFKREQQMKISPAHDMFSDFFLHLYTNARTISRLPSVRDIDRYGKNLTMNDRITIQENYNNMFSLTGVSEIYIVSKDFDPDKIDPNTKKPEAPIIAFDELIVGHTKDDYSSKIKDAEKGSNNSREEEIEIEEYHLIKEQIAYFKEHYPTLSHINGFDVPAISGREVITCDNSRYSPKKPNNADRSGFVYSVPFYGMDGEFKGVISTIFLTHVFRDYFGKEHAALINNSTNSKGTNVFLPHTVPHQLDVSHNFIKKGMPDPGLFYSEVIPLVSHDITTSWKLWVGVPNHFFYESSHYKTITQFRLIGDSIILIAIFLGIVATALMRRNHTLEEHDLKKAILKAEESNVAKSEFLANMSHELRTPMHAILNYTGMGLKRTIVLAENSPPDEKLSKFLTNIQISAHRLLGLLNDLLDLSKLEAGKMDFQLEEMSLHQAMDHSLTEVDSLLQEKGIKVAFDGLSTVNIHHVFYDKTRLIQVFVNVLSNAIKFSPEQSTIYIDYSVQEDREKKSYLHCAVRDQGSGIPKGEENKIFDKFIQSNKTKTGAGGTGLGLSICKEIMVAHDGDIWARSRPSGKGAEFIIALPL
ncbi:MAG: hypothetical protein K2X98_04725 [Alphaproteobacteria bacterium]|nr:hypothetical protein [Alphaproteobacteria bacterium]